MFHRHFKAGSAWEIKLTLGAECPRPPQLKLQSKQLSFISTAQPFNYNHSTTTIQLQPFNYNHFFYSVIYTGINQNKIIIEKIIRKNIIFYYYFLLEKMIIEKLLDTNNLCINLHSHIFEKCCGLSFSKL